MIIFGIIMALVAIFVVAVAVRPSHFSVSRSAGIDAPPDVVFEHVNDFHEWEAWSPWVKLDPNAKNTYAGPTAGVGAIFEWSGNNQVGQGRMTITESRPNELIRIKLEFLKPMKAVNTAEFAFKPDGPRTVVSWTTFGERNFVCKAFDLVLNCDKFLGNQFDKGLAQMKLLAESAVRK